MAALEQFAGTWRSERGHPYSTQTVTWTMADNRLVGHWLIEAAGPPPETGWQSNPQPLRHEVHLTAVTLDEGRVLFTLNGGPYITEFRLVGDDEAVLGAAPDKIPPEFSGPEFQRSIEGHRIRLRKLP